MYSKHNSSININVGSIQITGLHKKKSCCIWEIDVLLGNTIYFFYMLIKGVGVDSGRSKNHASSDFLWHYVLVWKTLNW